MMKKVVLYANPGRDVGLVCAKAVQQKLLDFGLAAPLLVTGSDCEQLAQSADLLICFGGDGTILHLARIAAPFGIPILTVNLGRRGFMAELAPDDTDKIAAIALAETHSIQTRMMLDASVYRQDEPVYDGFALNDVVVTGATRLVELAVFADRQCVTRFLGDGIIAATPTGSTAYSMSAGGPIIEPTAQNIIITPICAHALMAHSFVLTPERRVSIKIDLAGEKDGYLSVDGGSFALAHGDEITIKKSRHVTRLIKATEQTFYQTLNEKLGVNTP